MPLLDLTEREDFDAVPAGKYVAETIEAEETKSKGGGKMPEGTPMISLRWRIIEPYGDWEPTDNDGNPINPEGRGVFSNTVIAPPTYEKYKQMNGILFRTLLGLGYSKEELESGDFELDYNDLKGRKAVLTVGRYDYTDPDTEEVTVRNNVKGIKAYESSGVL